MSAAAELRALGLATLADPDLGSGEWVTFAGEQVPAVVRYDPPPEAPAGEMRQLTDRGQSVIEIEKRHLLAAPEVGEHFIGPDGRRHRVRVRPRTTDLTYVCDCTVSS